MKGELSSPSNSGNIARSQDITTTENQSHAMSPQSAENTLDHWLLIAGSFFCVCNTLGLSLTFGVYEDFYINNQLQGYSSSQVAWIATIQSFLMIFCGVFSGTLFDHGYFRSLLISGSALVSLGMFMTSISSHYYSIFLSQSLCVGLGMSCLYTSSLAVLSVNFKKRRQLALSIATSGTSIGGIIYPIVFEQLQPRVGFGWAVRAQAFIVLGTSAFACLAMLRRESPKQPPRSLVDRTAFKDKPYVTFCVCIFFQCIAYWIPFTYIPTFGVYGAGASSNYSFYLLAIANGVSIVGRVAPAVFIEYVAPSRFMCGCMVLSTILIFCWIPVATVASFTAWCVLWGIFSGPLGTLPASIVVELTTDMSVIGTRLGMMWAFGSFGVLIGNPTAGALSKRKGYGFVGGQSFAGAAMAVAGVLMLVTIWLQRRGASDPSKASEMEKSNHEEV